VGQVNLLVTVKGVLWTLKAVANPWSVALIYLTGKPQNVRFRGCLPLTMNKSEFLAVRRNMFKGWKPTGKFRQHIVIEKDGVKLVLSGGLGAFNEDMEGMYGHIQYDDKVVLDVGGHMGDTAIYFHKKGAKKIIVYEPVPEFYEGLKLNILLNDVPAEIHNLGISTKDGFLEVSYDELNTAFGLNPGEKKKKIRVVKVDCVLKKGIDVAKFDCEGFEYSLLNVPKQKISKIPIYIIEYHHGVLPLIDKFRTAGYRCRVIRGDSQLGILMATRK